MPPGVPVRDRRHRQREERRAPRAAHPVDLARRPRNNAASRAVCSRRPSGALLPDRHPPAAAAARRTAVHLILALLLATIAAAIITPARAGALEAGVADQKAWVWKDPRIRALGLRHARLIVPWNAATRSPPWCRPGFDAPPPRESSRTSRSSGCAPTAARTRPAPAERRAVPGGHRRVHRAVPAGAHLHHLERGHPPEPAGAHASRSRRRLLPAAHRRLPRLHGGGRRRARLRQLHRLAALVPLVLRGSPAAVGHPQLRRCQRGTTAGTDAVLATVPGTVWMEETGGNVQLRGALSGGGSTAAARPSRPPRSTRRSRSHARGPASGGSTSTRCRPGRTTPSTRASSAQTAPPAGLRHAPAQPLQPRAGGGGRHTHARACGRAHGHGAVVGASRRATRGHRALRGRCAACSGSVRLSVRTRGARARTWQVKTVATRSYAATTGTATVQVVVPARLRARMRRAPPRGRCAHRAGAAGHRDRDRSPPPAAPLSRRHSCRAAPRRHIPGVWRSNPRVVAAPGPTDEHARRVERSPRRPLGHLLLTARSLGLALLAGLALGLPATTAQARPIALDRSDAPGAKRATTSTAQLRATLAASMRGGPRAAVRRSPSAASALTVRPGAPAHGSVELPSESAAKAVERAARSSTTIGKRQSTALVVVRAGAAVGLIRLQVKGRDRAIRATADQYAALLKARSSSPSARSPIASPTMASRPRPRPSRSSSSRTAACPAPRCRLGAAAPSAAPPSPPRACFGSSISSRPRSAAPFTRAPTRPARPPQRPEPRPTHVRAGSRSPPIQ